MTLEDRELLFGDPTDSLVAEAVLTFQQRKGKWPRWDQLVAELARCERITRQEAEDRLLDALKVDEVLPRFEDGNWFIEVDDAMRDRINRRVLEWKLKRPDEEEVE